MTRLIDADLLRKQFRKRELERNCRYMNGAMIFTVRKIIDEAPTVEERPHGEWIEVDIKPLPYGGYTCNYSCKKCKYYTKEYHLNFCPNCGADMRKEGKAE